MQKLKGSSYLWVNPIDCKNNFYMVNPCFRLSFFSKSADVSLYEILMYSQKQFSLAKQEKGTWLHPCSVGDRGSTTLRFVWRRREQRQRKMGKQWWYGGWKVTSALGVDVFQSLSKLALFWLFLSKEIILGVFSYKVCTFDFVWMRIKMESWPR